MATDWESESISVYSDFESEGFELVVAFKGSPGIWNPVTLVYEGATVDTEYTTMGLISEYRLSEINNTTIQAGDRLMFIPSYGTDTGGLFTRMPSITVENAISIGGVEQNIITAHPVAPGNVTLMYKLQLR